MFYFIFSSSFSKCFCTSFLNVSSPGGLILKLSGRGLPWVVSHLTTGRLAALNFPTALIFQGWTSHLWWIQAWNSCKCTLQWFTHASEEDFIAFTELRCVLTVLWSSPLYPSCIEMSLIHSNWHWGGRTKHVMAGFELERFSCKYLYIFQNRYSSALQGDKIPSHVPQLQKKDQTKDRGLLTVSGVLKVTHSSSPTVCR